MLLHKFIRQHDKRDCGAACMATICNYYNIKISLADARELTAVDKSGVSVYGILQASKKLNLDAEALEGTIDELINGINQKEFSLPLIAHIVVDDYLGHYVVIKKISERHIYYFDPAKGHIKEQINEFSRKWTGIIISFKLCANKNTSKLKLTQYSKKIYWSLFKIGYKYFILALIVSLGIAFISILGTWLYQVVIDQYILGNGKNQIVLNFNSIFQLHSHDISASQLFISFIGLYLFQSILLFSRGHLLNIMSKKIQIKLSDQFYNHLLYLPLKFFKYRESGEILSRYQSLTDLQNLLVNMFLTVILESIMAFTGAIILIYISLDLFLLVTIIVIIYAVIVICFIKPLKHYMRKIADNDADILTHLNETIDGLERIKSDAIEKNFATIFHKKIDLLTNNTFTLMTYQNIVSSSVVSIENIGILSVLWKGCHLVLNNVISLGTLIAFESLIQFFVTPIKNLINVQTTIHSLIITVDRLNDILDAKPEKNIENLSFNKNIPLGNKIICKGLNFSYGYHPPVLTNINFEIEANSKVALIGKSGSGKSTLLKILATLETPTEHSELSWGNINSKLLNLPYIRSKLAYIPQESFLFTGTLQDNLLLPDQTVDSNYQDTIYKVCGLDILINSLPLGKKTMILENGNNLSGGEKQRISIARALLKKPEILLLDEATSNIDSITENKIFNFIIEQSNITVIAIFHNLKLIDKFDNVLFLDNGNLIANGKHTDLIHQCPEYLTFTKKDLN